MIRFGKRVIVCYSLRPFIRSIDVQKGVADVHIACIKRHYNVFACTGL